MKIYLHLGNATQFAHNTFIIKLIRRVIIYIVNSYTKSIFISKKIRFLIKSKK